MEHRWYRRVETAFAVNLYTSDGVTLKDCRVNNISMGGIVVDVSVHNEALGYSLKNGVVNVELRVKEFPETLPCLILRSDGKTMALMFIKHHPGLREFLNKLRLQEETSGVDLKVKQNETFPVPSSPVKTKRRVRS